MNYLQKENSNRILAVDDEEDVLDFLKIFLSSLGWRVTIAGSVTQAFEALQREAFFLVLTDIAMPEMDGYEFIASIREKRIPSEVALMTGFGYNPKHTLIKVKKSMRCMFFFKPFDKMKVAEGIQNSWNNYHRDFLPTE